MKKRIFAWALLLLGFMQGYAQNSPSADAGRARAVGRFEGEIGGGLSFGADRLNFDRSNPGAAFYAEARYNVQLLPLDVGVQVGGTIFHRESDHAGQLKFRSWNVMAVADYNFRRRRNVSFFAGAGVGYAFLDNSAPLSLTTRSPTGAASRREAEAARSVSCRVSAWSCFTTCG